MSLITVSDAETGVSCPYCRFPLKGGVVAMKCDACGAIHHQDCWDDGGGCSVFGCTHGATSQNAGQKQQLSKVAPNAVAATGLPDGGHSLQSADPGASKQITVLFLAIGVLATALIAVVLFLAFRKSNQPVTEAAGTPSVESASAEPDEVAKESDSLVARKVVRILRDYATAFENEDVSSLRQLLSPSVQRWGVNGPNVCKHDVGRDDVIGAYVSQFDANPPLSYTLTPLDTGIVERVSSKRARANTSYVISGSGSNPISFSFGGNGNGDWRITRVKVGTCV